MSGMRKRDRMDFMQAGAAVLTWAAVTGLAAWIVLRHGDAGFGSMSIYALLAAVNLAAILAACGRFDTSLAVRRTGHALMVVSALVLGWILPLSFMPIYTIIWMAMTPGLYSARVSWWLLLTVVVAWYPVMEFGWGQEGSIVSVILYATFHLFAMLAARAAVEAEEARNRAEFLNSELIASQHLLSEASRQGERTRIARDLHDLLGHHLTALSINLQIAERVADGEARERIAESRALARLLLSDVRDAVSTLREESAVDFARAVSLLVERVPRLEIYLDIADDLSIEEFEVAESLLRCVQEALTNTLRHAGANRSWIRLWREADDIHLEIRDDGSQSKPLVEGNGLTGMRERLAALRGTLHLDTVDDALRVHVTVPAAAT